MPYICDCGQALDLAATLDSLPPNGSSSSRMVYVKCTGCGEPIELRLANGRMEIGYSYFGGSMHFEVMKTVRVSGLKVGKSAPDDLDVTLGKRHWHFSVDTPSHLRFAVLGQAFAAGKRLSELNFSQWNVVVEAVERNQARPAPAEDPVLEDGDFLRLCGPAPALTLAWLYMNNGVDARKR